MQPFEIGILLRLIEILVDHIGEIETMVLDTNGSLAWRGKKDVAEIVQIGDVHGTV